MLSELEFPCHVFNSEIISPPQHLIVKHGHPLLVKWMLCIQRENTHIPMISHFVRDYASSASFFWLVSVQLPCRLYNHRYILPDLQVFSSIPTFNGTFTIFILHHICQTILHKTCITYQWYVMETCSTFFLKTTYFSKKCVLITLMQILSAILVQESCFNLSWQTIISEVKSPINRRACSILGVTIWWKDQSELPLSPRS